MAGICCGIVGESETSTAAIEPSSAIASKRRKMDQLLTAYKIIADAAVPPPRAPECSERKRQKVEKVNLEMKKLSNGGFRLVNGVSTEPESRTRAVRFENTRFGVTSVCGRRRDMEDAVSVHPRFSPDGLRFFGVFDGHGCSHVAMKCKHRLHAIVKEEIGSSWSSSSDVKWKEAMDRSFRRMDVEVQQRGGGGGEISACRCELQTPQCDAVGSTASVAVVTPEKIVVSNCGDSRAVLCRNGVAIPLSVDHKPDRPDELVRIEAAGGRVIYWDGARVLGMLAMSRAIGDNYLKPYVIPEPEVTITDRSDGDECLIIASDGLWDVVSNETACGVARMCLRAQNPRPGMKVGSAEAVESSDKACSDASILLTKLALARHSTDNVSVLVVDLRRDDNNSDDIKDNNKKVKPSLSCQQDTTNCIDDRLHLKENMTKQC